MGGATSLAQLLHMSYSLNFFKKGYIGYYIGEYYRVFEGDTRSLEYSSSHVCSFVRSKWFVVKNAMHLRARVRGIWRPGKLARKSKLMQV